MIRGENEILERIEKRGEGSWKVKKAMMGRGRGRGRQLERGEQERDGQ